LALYIQRLGLHVPRYRLEGRAAAEFWGHTGRRGTRAVANWDEDIVTMGVVAAERCLGDADRADIGTVIVASTTHPYAEKQSAALVAEALNLPQDVDTIDVGTSLRAGTQALRLAADRVVAGGLPVLVVAGDTRAAVPDSPEEAGWGDAAAAVLVAASGPVELRFVTTRYETWLSRWRLAGDQYGRAGDSRFVAGMTERSLQFALEETWKEAAEVGGAPSRLAVATAIAAAAARAAAAVGFSDEPVVHGAELHTSIGYTGAAAPFFSLASALQHAMDGESVALTSVGDGVDAAVAVVHDASAFSSALSVATASSRTLSYGRYLRVREVVADPPLSPFSSEIAQSRDVKHTARLQGARCTACGFVAYPPQPVCSQCHSYGAMEDVALARTGRLLTFTVEHLFPNPESRLAMGVVELGDNVHFYCPITDIAPEELEVGLPVRLVYRRLHRGGGFINYFWKATHAEEAEQ
jgi:hydroxymethylglutaryl-CoA synthase